MNNRPIYMLPILACRADSSTEEERPRGASNIIDREGRPVADPTKNPELNCLEGDPNLNWEHWGEFWRKVHGPCAFYKDPETPEDRIAEAACSYYQIHRMSAAPSSYFCPPYLAPCDENGNLFPYLYDKVPAYKRPRFDGMVYWGARNGEDLKEIAFGKKAVNKFNDQGNIFTRIGVNFQAAEYVIKPHEGKLPPICAVKVHRRKEGTKKDFCKMLLDTHADEIMKGDLATQLIRRFAYIINLNESEDDLFYSEAGQLIDAISVTFFSDMEDCETYFGSDEYRIIEEKEE